MSTRRRYNNGLMAMHKVYDCRFLNLWIIHYLLHVCFYVRYVLCPQIQSQEKLGILSLRVIYLAKYIIPKCKKKIMLKHKLICIWNGWFHTSTLFHDVEIMAWCHLHSVELLKMERFIINEPWSIFVNILSLLMQLLITKLYRHRMRVFFAVSKLVWRWDTQKWQCHTETDEVIGN